jgi:hypothetical protein
MKYSVIQNLPLHPRFNPIRYMIYQCQLYTFCRGYIIYIFQSKLYVHHTVVTVSLYNLIHCQKLVMQNGVFLESVGCTFHIVTLNSITKILGSKIYLTLTGISLPVTTSSTETVPLTTSIVFLLYQYSFMNMVSILNTESKYNNMYLYAWSTEFKQKNLINPKILNFTVYFMSNTNHKLCRT